MKINKYKNETQGEIKYAQCNTDSNKGVDVHGTNCGDYSGYLLDQNLASLLLSSRDVTFLSAKAMLPFGSATAWDELSVLE